MFKRKDAKAAEIFIFKKPLRVCVFAFKISFESDYPFLHR